VDYAKIYLGSSKCCWYKTSVTKPIAEIVKRFDIFWFGEEGAMWIEAVDTLEIAKVRVEQLRQSRSGSYEVMDCQTGNRISFPEDDKRS
jgi:hypothetical protein